MSAEEAFHDAIQPDWSQLFQQKAPATCNLSV
jgi:hypothetical protein